MASSIELLLAISSTEFLLCMVPFLGIRLCAESPIGFLIEEQIAKVENKTEKKNIFFWLLAFNHESLIKISISTLVSLPFSPTYSSKFSNTLIAAAISK